MCQFPLTYTVSVKKSKLHEQEFPQNKEKSKTLIYLAKYRCKPSFVSLKRCLTSTAWCKFSFSTNYACPVAIGN